MQHDAALNAVVYGKKRWFLCRNYANMTEGQFAALKLALGGEATGFGTTRLIDDEDLCDLMGIRSFRTGQDIRMTSWLTDVYPRPEVQAAMAEAG